MFLHIVQASNLNLKGFIIIIIIIIILFYFIFTFIAGGL
jgi:hypothetical protein